MHGNRFGPADISLLNEWSAQGRIAPNTVLVEEASGAQMMAHQVPGLNLPTHMPPPGGGFGPISGGAAAYGNPFGSQPNAAFDGSAEASKSLWMSGISLVLCAIIPCIGIIPAIMAIGYASSASRKCAPNGSTAMVLAIGALALQILQTLIGFSVIRMLSGG